MNEVICNSLRYDIILVSIYTTYIIDTNNVIPKGIKKTSFFSWGSAPRNEFHSFLSAFFYIIKEIKREKRGKSKRKRGKNALKALKRIKRK